MAAAVLLGFFGGLLGLGLALYGLLRLDTAGLPLTVIGVGVLVLAVTAIAAMARRSRIGQVITLVLGMGLLLGGFYTLSQGGLVSIVWMAAGAAIALLVVVPVAARDWFAPQPESGTLSSL